MKFINVPFPKKFKQLLHESGVPCQQITANALLRNFQEVPLRSAMIAWIYQAVSNFCAASVKLLRLGEIACQKIIYNCINKERMQGILSAAFTGEEGGCRFF